MADSDGVQGQPWQNSTQQDDVGQQTADSADIGTKRGDKSARSSTQQLLSWDLQDGVVCLDAGFPGGTLSGLKPYPGCTGRRSAVFRGYKRRSGRKTAALTGVRRAKSPFFRGQRSWLWRHLSEKQQVKDSGVCRVIWTISRGSRHCNSSTAPLNSRIQPHFLTRI